MRCPLNPKQAGKLSRNLSLIHLTELHVKDTLVIDRRIYHLLWVGKRPSEHSTHDGGRPRIC